MKRFEQFRTLSKEAKRRIVLRYALYQIPDIGILALILYVLHRWVDLSLWLYTGIVSLWMVKYVLAFSFVWRAYDKPRPGDVKSLIGTEGIAEERLDPSGYIRVHGELWRAEVIGKTVPVEKGETVLIERASGLTLLVKPVQKK
jgi:membrane protein implicated in regulation of membrane protease activity